VAHGFRDHAIEVVKGVLVSYAKTAAEGVLSLRIQRDRKLRPKIEASGKANLEGDMVVTAGK